MNKEELQILLYEELDFHFQVLDNKILLEKSPSGRVYKIIGKYVEVLTPVYIDPDRWGKSKYYRQGFRWFVNYKQFS